PRGLVSVGQTFLSAAQTISFRFSIRLQAGLTISCRLQYKSPPCGIEDGSSSLTETRMVDPVRQEVIALAHTVVVKVGTNVLTGPDGALDPARLQALADQIERLRQAGRKVALVSSGAIGAGVGRLGMGKRPDDLRHLQACAAIGQGFLMRAYQECLQKYGTHTAQILLT